MSGAIESPRRGLSGDVGVQGPALHDKSNVKASNDNLGLPACHNQTGLQFALGGVDQKLLLYDGEAE